MDKKIIFDRLAKGEDPESIAKEFTDLLNEANKEYTKKKEEVQMMEELQDIIDMFIEWMCRYYNTTFNLDVRADQVIELIDGLKGYLNALSTVKPMLDKTTANDYDKIVEEFVKGMRW